MLTAREIERLKEANGSAFVRALDAAREELREALTLLDDACQEAAVHIDRNDYAKELTAA